MKHIVKYIHFIGIGGSGMSGIAEVLLNLGYKISGSDLEINRATLHLKSLGACVYHGHSPENIAAADVVVMSNAIHSSNPELLAAHQAKIPVITRALMLAELMRAKQAIAIAGAHGKTTTTSLITAILAAAGMDPTFVIGGILNSVGSNAKLGIGEFIVVETDESDASFLNLFPTMEVITNIDNDHMETYGYDLNKLKQAFIDFVEHLPFYGCVALCIDDQNVRDILPKLTKTLLTYGFSKDAQVRAIDVLADNERMHFTLLRKDNSINIKQNLAQIQEPIQTKATDTRIPVTLNLSGAHNVLNALAAYVIANKLGICDKIICNTLANFTGVSRRFQNHGHLKLPKNGDTFTLIEDYGHHPTALTVTIDAAKAAFPKRRVVLVFQPHRYSRTKDCFADFVTVLSNVDVLLLTEIYSAGEEPIDGISGQALALAIYEKRTSNSLNKSEQSALDLDYDFKFIAALGLLANTCYKILRKNDLVLVMGAGSVNQVVGQLIHLSKKVNETSIENVKTPLNIELTTALT